MPSSCSLRRDEPKSSPHRTRRSSPRRSITEFSTYDLCRALSLSRQTSKVGLSWQHVCVARAVAGDEDHDWLVLSLGEVRLTGRLGVEAAGRQRLQGIGREVLSIAHVPGACKHEHRTVVTV